MITSLPACSMLKSPRSESTMQSKWARSAPQRDDVADPLVDGKISNNENLSKLNSQLQQGGQP